MQALSKDTVSPVVSPHGEIIYELIGRAVGETTERHSVAYVVLPPGKSSVLHRHPQAEESYYILQGKARLLLADKDATLTPQQAVLIPPQTPHLITNIGEADLVFLAVCVPAWEPSNTELVKPPEHLSRDELLELYKHYAASIKDELSFFYQYFHFYIGLLSAILAGTLTGLLSIGSEGSRGLVLLVGPVLILALGRVGYDNVSAFYRRFTETWVTKINLESMLNIRHSSLVEPGIQKPAYVSCKRGFIPEIEWPPLRTVFDEAEKNAWSAEQVAHKLIEVGTTLSNAKWTFILFGVAAFVFAVVTVLTVVL